MKTGRNEPCPCGSGRKFKHCCLKKKSSMPVATRFLIAALMLLLAGVIAAIISTATAEKHPDMQGKVWSEEHQHWH